MGTALQEQGAEAFWEPDGVQKNNKSTVWKWAITSPCCHAALKGAEPRSPTDSSPWLGAAFGSFQI